MANKKEVIFMLCPKCGATLTDDTKTCPSCYEELQKDCQCGKCSCENHNKSQDVSTLKTISTVLSVASLLFLPFYVGLANIVVSCFIIKKDSDTGKTYLTRAVICMVIGMILRGLISLILDLQFI